MAMPPASRVALKFLGCKVNQAEVTRMRDQLIALGHQIVEIEDSPDYCIVNTCTVTAKSDLQSRQLIRRAASTGAKVIVTGCYSELNKDEASGIDGVQAVIPNSSKSQLISMITDNTERLSSILISPSGSMGRTRYFLKVQDGCDNMCTYCLICIARNKPKSMLPDEALAEVKMAESAGYKEIVLTGIHLGKYGIDLGPGDYLNALIEQILKETSIPRIRLSSLEISEIDDHLLDLIGAGRIMGHLHIPLQSGSDPVLRAMGRRYSRDDFGRVIKKISAMHENIAIGTDIIAGFPNETNEMFSETLELVESLPLTYLHVFPYSARNGTKAAEMRDIVGDPERKDRAARLREISERKRKAYLARQRDRELNVLFENSTHEGFYSGFAENYIKVTVHSDFDVSGMVKKVKAKDVSGAGLLADVIKTS